MKQPILRHILLGFLVSGLLLAPLHAQPPALSERDLADLRQVLAALQQIQDTREQSVRTRLQAVARQIDDAASEDAKATAFYLDAVKAIKFTGQDESMAIQFRDWKDKNKDAFKGPESRTALRLHLRYLSITLERAASKDTAAVIPRLQTYYADLLKAHKDVGAQKEFLGSPLDQSVFTPFLQIGDQIASVKDWEMTPGNIGGIEDKIILPYLRANQPAQLISFWDTRIAREKDDSKDSALASQNSDFEQRRLPTLYWRRADDLVLVGRASEGCKEMIGLVKTYPAHPEFDKWCARLGEILKKTIPGAK